MKRSAIAAGLVLAAAILATAALYGGLDEQAPASIATAPGADAASTASAAPARAQIATTVRAPRPVASEAPSVPAPPPGASADPRVPPIDPAEPGPTPAQPWEIADPAQYQARERRLAQEVAQRYVQAADARLPQWHVALEEMRAHGASPAEIERAEDKIRHLEAVREALLRGDSAVGR